jgi:hypothetical protein
MLMYLIIAMLAQQTKDEDFVDDIHDIKMVKEMGIQTWVGKRSLKQNDATPYGSKIPQIYVVETKEQSLKKGLEENQKDLRDVEATKITQAHPSKK